MLSLFNLRWRKPSQPLPPQPLPEGVKRTFIPTPHGPLELLSAIPSTTSSSIEKTDKVPLFFLHGGFGAASVWIPWMLFFRSKGYPCYALSLRGHGESWLPGFFSMVWRTGIDHLAEDALAGLVEVHRMEGERRGKKSRDPVLLGHSSGGGLAQYLLSEGRAKTEALVLCGAVPGFGSMDVYWNWFKLDPFFPIRNWLHLGHPRSPLSSTRLVRNVFFTQQLPTTEVQDFESRMPYWESMLWPIKMMRPFVSFSNLVKNIYGWDRGSRVCVVGGAQDKIVTIPIAMQLAANIRAAAVEEAKKKSTGSLSSVDLSKDAQSLVTFAVVEKGPHHFQNDLCREKAAEIVLGFLEELD